MRKKFTILIFIGVLLCMSCSPKSHLTANNENGKSLRKEFNRISLQDSVINYGLKYLSTPYRFGGTTPRGFDCSGFTSHVYGQFGYNLGRSSRDQAKQLPGISKRELQTGDLVFFEGRSHNGHVGHVGIVTERKSNGEFNFLHASVKNGVVVSSSEEPYYASRYLKAGRVVNKPGYLSLANQNQSYQKNENVIKSSMNQGQYSYMKKESRIESKNKYDAVYHTVKKGEDLFDISKEYDVPISTIQQLNGLKSKRIKKGQRLIISEAVNVPDVPKMEIISPNSEDILKSENKKKDVINYSDSQPKQVAKVEIKHETKPVKQLQNHTQTDISPKSEKYEPQEKSEIKTVELNLPKELDEKSVTSVQNNVKIDQKPEPIKLFEKKEVKFDKSKTDEKQFVNQNIGTKTHHVSAGETLYSISRMYNLSVDEIKKLNSLEGNTISVGQNLIVNNPESKNLKMDKPDSAAIETHITHIVQSGETLYSIARKYNCKVNDLRKWNSSLSNNIHQGDKIRIEKD
ncbi:MAG: LysM peptidoglycan-binding domain-containing protein [Paludibacteraceae bacterium]